MLIFGLIGLFVFVVLFCVLFFARVVVGCCGDGVGGLVVVVGGGAGVVDGVLLGFAVALARVGTCCYRYHRDSRQEPSHPRLHHKLQYKLIKTKRKQDTKGNKQ